MATTLSIQYHQQVCCCENALLELLEFINAHNYEGLSELSLLDYIIDHTMRNYYLPTWTVSGFPSMQEEIQCHLSSYSIPVLLVTTLIQLTIITRPTLQILLLKPQNLSSYIEGDLRNLTIAIKPYSILINARRRMFPWRTGETSKHD
jgi:hypothetical protein